MKAEDYFYRIPDGHKNAIQRPPDGNIDRMLRRMIEDANKNGDCIINTGSGIFRPIPGDSVDEEELNKYLNTELNRARTIQYKRLCMKQAFEGWRSVAVHTNYTRETG